MLLKLSFFIYYLFHIEIKMFVGEKWRNLARWGKFPPAKNFARRKFHRSGHCFSEICCDAVKNTPCYQFLCKGFKTFSRFRGFGFHWSNYIFLKFWKWLKQELWSLKLSFIGQNPFLQMYCNKISLFTDWFLMIKWLCTKSVKITIQKNSYPKK